MELKVAVRFQLFVGTVGAFPSTMMVMMVVMVNFENDNLGTGSSHQQVLCFRELGHLSRNRSRMVLVGRKGTSVVAWPHVGIRRPNIVRLNPPPRVFLLNGSPSAVFWASF